MRKTRLSFGMRLVLLAGLLLLLVAPFLALPVAAQDDLLEKLTPQSWGDWVVVVLAIVAVQGIKKLLPSPEGEPRWAALVTARINRVLPYLPVVVATILFVLWNKGAVVLGENGPAPPMPLGQLLQHGAALGVYAAYLYKAGKATFFGS